MALPVHNEIPELELAILRRGVHDLSVGCERCARCHRTPLIGERVYVYDSEKIVCELCRPVQRGDPSASRIVHGPEFGHTLRVSDHRAAA